MTESQLTLFAEDSPAKISAKPVNKRASRPKGRASGVSAPDCLGKFDPSTQSLKTSQHSFLETEGDGFSEFCGTFPRQGMMRSGTVFELPILEQDIIETEFGLWPTPTTFDVSGGAYPTELINGQWRSRHSKDKNSPLYGAKLKDAVETSEKIWKTPTANEDAAGTPNGKMQKMLGNDPDLRLDSEGNLIPGTLNPTWVEWLMGFPTGHTDLKD